MLTIEDIILFLCITQVVYAAVRTYAFQVTLAGQQGE